MAEKMKWKSETGEELVITSWSRQHFRIMTILMGLLIVLLVIMIAITIAAGVFAYRLYDQLDQMNAVSNFFEILRCSCGA